MIYIVGSILILSLLFSIHSNSKHVKALGDHKEFIREYRAYLDKDYKRRRNLIEDYDRVLKAIQLARDK